MRSNIKPGFYDGLNNHEVYNPKFHQPSIAEIVKAVDSANYGTHRFLSELIRVRKERLNEFRKKYPDEKDELMEGIEKLLNEGCF